jgi:TM2 domain-containing membrane protein YozV
MEFQQTPGATEAQIENRTYKFTKGSCAARVKHEIVVNREKKIINIKKKTGFCCCCMNQVNGSAVVKNVNNIEIVKPTKSLLCLFLLWLPPFGILGAHRYYMGKTKSAVLWTLTFGFFLIGWLVDVCLLSSWVGPARAHFNLGKERTDVFYDVFVDPLEVKKLRDELLEAQMV